MKTGELGIGNKIEQSSEESELVLKSKKYKKKKEKELLYFTKLETDYLVRREFDVWSKYTGK